MKINRWVVLLSAVAMLSFSANAQDSNRQNRQGQSGQGQDRQGPPGMGQRPNWDPAQMQQRMMEMVKERLEISDEAEWKAIQPLVQKVMDVQRQNMGDRMRGMFGGRRGGENRDSNRSSGESDRNRGGFGQSAEAEALQKAIDAKASASEVKSAMTKYVEARKSRQAELESAQDALRKVLTPRQEAIATLSGWL